MATDEAVRVLERAECLELLRSRTVGRVAYTDGALPAVTPVNYAVMGNAIVFRTRPGGRLARATADAVVAFEVDELDEASHSGWSVVVLGVAEHLTLESDLVRVDATGLAPWAGDSRTHVVRIVPADVTGRRIVSGTALLT